MSEQETEPKDGEKSLSEHLRMVGGSIIADGKVDFEETTQLLEILKPLGEFDAKAIELRKVVEEVRADGVVTDEESAKLIALIKDFMTEAAHWSLATCPACKHRVPVSSLRGAPRKCPDCGAEIPATAVAPRKGIFRKAAMEKAAHPFQKEQIPSVFRLPIAITASVLAVVLVSFCIWCGLGSIAENVHGAGILMHKGRYVALTSPGEGLVVSFDVKVGNTVTNGQKVGVLYSKTDAEQLPMANRRLERLKSDYDRIAAECRAVADKKKSQHAQFLTHLDDFDKRIAGQVEWYKGHLDRMNQLKNSGAVSAITLREAVDSHDDRIVSQEKSRVERIRSEAELDDALFRLRTDLIEREERITDASLDAERILREMDYRATIVAETSGRISNVNVATGDRVKIGDALAVVSVVMGGLGSAPVAEAATVRSEKDGWELVAYFSAAEARKLVKGMDAVVTPSTVKAEREGGIRGKVTHVGTDFETPESILCDFRNDAFTQWIMSRTDGMPVKVRMLLEADPGTMSGFRWTGGSGPEIRIADGTVAAAAVTVRRHRPAKLAFAKVIRYATGDGEMEESILGN